MQKALFLCSRMAPFGLADLRSELKSRFGEVGGNQNAYRLHVEFRDLREGEDARLFCARAIQSSDAVVLVLDGSGSTALSPFDAPVLELEVMLAAACAKPVLVLDGSDGNDPLFRLLSTEFFSVAGRMKANIVSLLGASPVEKVSHLQDVLAQTLGGDGTGAAALSEQVGWERLFLARPDRLDAFDEDGGNFPFSRLGLTVPDMMSSDIARLLDRAEASFKVDKMAALVFGWDAIRALSSTPWDSPILDRTIAVLWLRALTTWGGAMAWLGLFGHSSGAAVMTNLACRRIASRIDSPETKVGARYAVHTFLGGLASTYFSLSKLVASREAQAAVRRRGILYATDALKRVDAPRARAGLLAVRGPLLLSTGSPAGVVRGFLDLTESVRLHKRDSAGNTADAGTATSRIQLGAAYKELAKRTFRNRISLRLGQFNLEAAYDVLNGAYEANEQVDQGQLLMCMKHLVETRLLLGRDSDAVDLWERAMSLAREAGIADQLRQLQDIGKSAGWSGVQP